MLDTVRRISPDAWRVRREPKIIEHLANLVTEIFPTRGLGELASYLKPRQQGGSS